MCWLFDTKNLKMGVYMTRGTSVNLTAVRLCTYDFQVVQYGKGMRPTVEDMQKLAKKSSRARKD